MKLVRTSHFIGFIGSWWNKRTQLNSFPGLFAAARNREFLWRLQIGRHYRFFFRGFGLLFCVHLLRHSGSIYRGFFQVSFVFFELVTWLDFTLITFDKKGNAVPVQTGVRFFGFSSENKLHHRKARRYETICFFDRSRYLVCTSIDSGPCVACLVRMRDDVLLLHNWDNNFYSVHEHDFVSLRHSCRWINRGNRSHISLAIFWLQLLTSIVLVAANGSVCMHRCKSTLKPKPTSQYLPMYLPSSNLDPRVSLLWPPRQRPREAENRDLGNEVGLVPVPVFSQALAVNWFRRRIPDVRPGPRGPKRITGLRRSQSRSQSLRYDLGQIWRPRN